jgi:hypothetical protein
MNKEIALEVQRIKKIVSTVTGRDLISEVRDHKNVMARSIFCKMVYDYLKKNGMRRGAKSYIAKYLGKNHATVLYSLNNFEADILGSPLNRKMYEKCAEVFESLGDVYTTMDERDLTIDNLKNKITDLQLQLRDARPYRQEVELLVELVNKVPSEHISDAEFRIITMLKGFKIEPKNQRTKVIGSYETVTSF